MVDSALNENFDEELFETITQKLGEDYESSLAVFLGSPADLLIRDEEGNVLSKEDKMGILGAFFYEHKGKKFAVMANPKGEYKIEVHGKENGTYDLRIKTTEGRKITNEKEYRGVQLTPGKIDIYGAEIKHAKEEQKSSAVYFLPLVIIIAIIVGLYIGSSRFGITGRTENFEANLTEKLHSQLKDGKLTRKEYARKLKDLGLDHKTASKEEIQRITESRIKNKLIRRLDEKIEGGEMSKEEYGQKMEDLGLTPENETRRRLMERYIKGEIDKKEYLRKKRDLEEA